MPNLAQAHVITVDPRRIALYRWIYAHAAPERGLPPVPLP
jgi:hypothetical protein